MSTTALFIGRFQPFHLGHLNEIKNILNNHDKIIIAIGSSEQKNEKTNPLSFLERKKLIKDCLKAEKIQKIKYRIIPLPDINNNYKWGEYVNKTCPKYDVLYTGAQRVKDCFVGKYAPAKIKDTRVVFIKKKLKISGTVIRTNILNNSSWKALLPKTVVHSLTEWKIRERLLKLNNETNE